MQPVKVEPGRSTGPRTSEGKARSRMNAKRHGLAAPIESDAQLREEASQLSRLLAGDKPDHNRRYFAARAANAEVALRRVQRVELSKINGRYAEARVRGEPEADAVVDILSMLLKLERYEKSARGRKMKALQCL
jgi:hypothetical protein